MTNRDDMTDKEKEYEERKKTAQQEMAATLEQVLATFPEDELEKARRAIAYYVLGYLGVSWGIKIGK